MRKFIASIILLVYAFILTFFLVTNKIRNYIHPRLYVFLIISIIMLLILFFYSVYYVQKYKKPIFLNRGMLAFLIPILLIFIPSDINTSTSVAGANGIKIYNVLAESKDVSDNQKGKDENSKKMKLSDEDVQAIKQAQKEKAINKDINDTIEVDKQSLDFENNKDKIISNEISIEDNKIETSDYEQTNEEQILENEQINEEQILDDGYSEEIKNEVITDNYGSYEPSWEPKIVDGVYYITDEDFANAVYQIQENIQNYKGKKLSYTGLIYKQEDFENHEFVVGRMLMYCCAADAQIVGFLGTCAGADEYNDGDWVTIVGSIDVKPYKAPEMEESLDIPYLRIENINLISPPKEQYVYF